jgi:hypothetical protein
LSAISKDISNPNLSVGSEGDKIKKVLIYSFATGASTLLGFWANGAIKSKLPSTNGAIVDGLQIGGGIALTMVKHPIVQCVGVGQSIAGAIGLTQKGVGYLKGKMIPATSPPATDGW